MPILHEGRVAPDGVFEHRPDLPLHVFLYLERVAEQVEAEVGEVVDLPEEECEASGSTLGAVRVWIWSRIRRQQSDPWDKKKIPLKQSEIPANDSMQI